MDTGRLLPTCEHVFSLIHLVLTFVDINLCVRLVPVQGLVCEDNA